MTGPRSVAAHVTGQTTVAVCVSLAPASVNVTTGPTGTPGGVLTSDVSGSGVALTMVTVVVSVAHAGEGSQTVRV